MRWPGACFACLMPAHTSTQATWQPWAALDSRAPHGPGATALSGHPTHPDAMWTWFTAIVQGS